MKKFVFRFAARIFETTPNTKIASIDHTNNRWHCSVQTSTIYGKPNALFLYKYRLIEHRPESDTVFWIWLDYIRWTIILNMYIDFNANSWFLFALCDCGISWMVSQWPMLMLPNCHNKIEKLYFILRVERNYNSERNFSAYLLLLLLQ